MHARFRLTRLADFIAQLQTPCLLKKCSTAACKAATASLWLRPPAKSMMDRSPLITTRAANIREIEKSSCVRSRDCVFSLSFSASPTSRDTSVFCFHPVVFKIKVPSR